MSQVPQCEYDSGWGTPLPVAEPLPGEDKRKQERTDEDQPPEGISSFPGAPVEKDDASPKQSDLSRVPATNGHGVLTV